jgi:hypothetical protein
MAEATRERHAIGCNDQGQTEWGAGLMHDGMTPYVPGTNCLDCGRFVGRDGYIGIGHFEMSNEIAWVEGQCARCLKAEREARPDRYGFTATGQTKVIAA